MILNIFNIFNIFNIILLYILANLKPSNIYFIIKHSYQAQMLTLDAILKDARYNRGGFLGPRTFSIFRVNARAQQSGAPFY